MVLQERGDDSKTLAIDETFHLGIVDVKIEAKYISRSPCFHVSVGFRLAIGPNEPPTSIIGKAELIYV